MIAGAGERYRIEVHRPNGKAIVLERLSDPVPVEGDEAEFHAHMATSSLKLMTPDRWISSGDIPTHKPAFRGFYPDRSGRERALAGPPEANTRLPPALRTDSTRGARAWRGD